MAFAILRVKKMNTMGAIAGKDSHELRQRETLNADVAKESLNRQVIGTNAADDVRERLAATGVVGRAALLVVEAADLDPDAPRRRVAHSAVIIA